MKAIVHWNKQQKMWTYHIYKGCQWAPLILIQGPWHTETKPEKKANPRGWIVSTSENVILNPDSNLLNQFEKTKQLIYDKEKVSFNIAKGEYLLFDQQGCFVVQPKGEES